MIFQEKHFSRPQKAIYGYADSDQDSNGQQRTIGTMDVHRETLNKFRSKSDFSGFVGRFEKGTEKVFGGKKSRLVIELQELLFLLEPQHVSLELPLSLLALQLS